MTTASRCSDSYSVNGITLTLPPSRRTLFVVDEIRIHRGREVGAPSRIGTLQNAPTIAASGGLLNRPFIALSATRLRFVAAAPGVRSATQTLLVSNAGAVPFSISGISATGEFAQTNTCSAILPPGSSCSVSVAFLPSSSAARVGSVTIRDGAQNSPHTVLLSGVTGRQRAVSH